MKPFNSKFVLYIKLHLSDGSIVLDLGNKQEFGLNYEETFVSVTEMIIVRTILAIIASELWQILELVL